MKIAHVGPIASNALLNAHQQQQMGIAADSFDLGAGPAGWTGYWEWGDWDVDGLLATETYDWRRISMTNGYVRPSWQKTLGWTGGPDWFDTLDDTYYELCTSREKTKRLKAPTYPHSDARIRRDLRGLLRCEPVRAIAAAYDLVILYGPEACYGVVLDEQTKYVTFECSTMRSVPELREPSQRLLAHSYQRAAANIITNADCRRAAEALGILDRSRFIPHPVDLEKFGPANAGSGAALREKLLSDLDAELLFFAPARQQRSADPDAKGNAKVLAAFSRYVKESEPKGAPRAGLLLLQWGSNVAAVDEWIGALGLTDRVAWIRPMHKTRLVPLYDAVDVVLDQFAESVGSYGTTVVEALAMGKPVITHINEGLHAWCRDVIPTPPHHEALETQDIWGWMTTLAHAPGARKNAGEQGAAWAREWCSPERIQGLNLQLYEDVLNG